MGALIRKGALIGRRALNRIITVLLFELAEEELCTFLAFVLHKREKFGNLVTLFDSRFTTYP